MPSLFRVVYSEGDIHTLRARAGMSLRRVFYLPMKESDFQTIFGQWLRQCLFFKTACAFELKLVDKGKRLKLLEVKEHQVHALCDAQANQKDSPGLYYKLTDMSLGLKPFDCIFLKGVDAYIVVAWWKKGKGIEGAYFMPVRLWERLRNVRDQSTHKGSKSLSESEFEALGGKWIDFKEKKEGFL